MLRIKKSEAFTISEVLIALTLVGIIAVIAMPALMSFKQKATSVSGFKKIYSSLKNLVPLSEVDNGSLADWTFTSGNNDGFMNAYLIPYLKISKNCSTSESGCWAGGTSPTVNYLNNSGTSNISSYSRIKLDDGIYLALNVTGDGYANILVDIDGKSGENIYGKDVFWFILTPKALSETFISVSKEDIYPMGAGINRASIFTQSPNGCSKSRSGAMCSGLIVEDGFKIASDYPW